MAEGSKNPNLVAVLRGDVERTLRCLLGVERTPGERAAIVEFWTTLVMTGEEITDVELAGHLLDRSS